MKFDFSVCLFRKSVEKIQVCLKYDKNNGHSTRRPVYINTSLNSSWNKKNVSAISCRENQNTFLSPENNMEKYCRDGQDTDDNMANAHWMLDI